jgi:hypothetical protein
VENVAVIWHIAIWTVHDFQFFSGDQQIGAIPKY